MFKYSTPDYLWPVERPAETYTYREKLLFHIIWKSMERSGDAFYSILIQPLFRTKLCKPVSHWSSERDATYPIMNLEAPERRQTSHFLSISAHFKITFHPNIQSGVEVWTLWWPIHMWKWHLIIPKPLFHSLSKTNPVYLCAIIRGKKSAHSVFRQVADLIFLDT